MEDLVMLFQLVSDVSSRVTCRIVLLEDPICPREDKQHVWVFVICKDGFIPKSVESAFHMDVGPEKATKTFPRP